MKIRKFNSEILLDVFIYLVLIFVFIITLYPFWNIFVISVNDGADAIKGGIYLWPRVFSLDSYRTILLDQTVIDSFKVTILRTVIGSVLAVFCTAMLAYALSRRDLVGRKFISWIFLFTMYFGGGLIPYYMVLKSVHLIDNFMVYIIPSLVSVFNMILVKTYMEQLPEELTESAKLDGANDLIIFFKIVIPLAMPVLATIGLFNAIFQWNSWFDSYVFTSKPSLKTLQAVLVKILNQYQTGTMVSASQQLVNSANHVNVTSESIRMATTMVATIPIIMVYPFLQKYFVKGIMVGAIKS